MNENKRRQILKRATITCLLLIVFVFLYVIFQGLLWSPNLSKEEAYKDFSEGETRLVRNQQQRYWVTKISERQRQQFLQLGQFVHSNNEVCYRESSICEIDARSQRSGVLIQFVIQRPAQLPSNNLWFGGYIDPASGAVYDIFGRGYLSNSKMVTKILSTKPN